MIKFKASFSAVLGLAFATGTWAGPIVTFDSTIVEDTYIDSSASETNFSDERFIQHRSWSGGITRAGLYKFDLPVLPDGSTVIGAELIVKGATTGTYNDLEVLGTTTPIDLSTITWASAITDNIIDGQDPDFSVDWDSIWTDFTPELFEVNGVTLFSSETYSDTDPAAGLLRFIQDNINTGSSVNITLATGFADTQSDGATDSILSFRSSNDDGTGTPVATGDTGWPTTNAPILRLTIQVPEPTSFALLSLGSVALLVRRRR